ncbi:MAG: HAMP domain-containing histidine kinase [Magnetococcales bacterium]|nr:HAMP domain-containing histidine kinase [Magnetococcales bacterium]
MSRMTDDELIEELKARFDSTKQALHDVKMVTKKLEVVNKKLEASEKVKSNFVSHMKNEINNPLTSILGLSQQLMTMGTPTQEIVASVSSMIHSEAFNLDFQLRNIFAAAELESGDTEIHVSVVDVDTVIMETVDSFEHVILLKRLSVGYGRKSQFEANERLYFKTDAEKLQLLFANLFSNAIEFNKDDGKVYIDVRLQDNRLLLSVTDTGVGVDKSQLSRIFDRFVQLEAGVTKTHKGHGLGLSITKAIVDMLEGSISVNNVTFGEDAMPMEKRPGKAQRSGCTFTIAIPEVEMDVDADAFSVDGNEFFFDDEKVEAF